MIFADINEVLMAHSENFIDTHAKIKIRMNGQLVETTAGRIIFNEILPEGLRFYNKTTNRKRVEELVAQCYQLLGQTDLGFQWATKSGATVSIDDLIIPKEKNEYIKSAEKDVVRIQKRYMKGIITNGERYNQIIDTWTRTTSNVAEVMFNTLAADQDGFNPVFMMADSGARGSKEQIRQLAGMRGLMAKPQKKITGGIGEIIENPITSNFREGLSVMEYFISTHGSRKGLADTALKTADAGYLTRRLVDVAQDVIIREIN